MVIVLLGVLAVFVLPNVNALKGFDEVGYRDKVRGALEFARKAAVSSRRSVQVTLSGNNLTFMIDNDTPEGDASPSSKGTYPRALALPAADRACGGATNQVCAPSGVTFTAAPTALVFNPLGQATATPAATTYGYTVTRSGGSTFNIAVAAETGYVY